MPAPPVLHDLPLRCAEEITSCGPGQRRPMVGSIGRTRLGHPSEGDVTIL